MTDWTISKHYIITCSHTSFNPHRGLTGLFKVTTVQPIGETCLDTSYYAHSAFNVQAAES